VAGCGCAFLVALQDGADGREGAPAAHGVEAVPFLGGGSGDDLVEPCFRVLDGDCPDGGVEGFGDVFACDFAAAVKIALLLPPVDHTLPPSMNECSHIKAVFAGGRSSHNATGVATAGDAVKNLQELTRMHLFFGVKPDFMRV
jgi:hypothetical protein